MQPTIPNLLTVFRVLLVPLIIVLFYSLEPGLGNYVVASVFIVAAATDWLDGYLARRWQQQSKFGQFLDPVADKLMVTTCLILLTQKFPYLLVTVSTIIIISREIIISALREWMALQGVSQKVAVNAWGKLKTVSQMVAIVVLLIAGHAALVQLGLGLLLVSTILTISSMLGYLQAAIIDN